MKKLSVFAALLLLTVIVFSGCTGSRTAKDGYTAYDSPGNYYSLDYPENWIVLREDGMFAIKSPQNSTNINIASFTLDKSITDINSYVDGSDEVEGYISLLKSTFNSVQIISDKQETLCALPSRRIVYSSNIGTDEFKFDISLVLNNDEVTNSLYVITYTATPEEFEADLPALEAVLQSFKIN